MLGKDIKIEKKGDGEIDRESPFFYIKELNYGIEVKKKIRPETVPTVGMDTIKATGWMAFFIDYASSSSFHGLNHLAAPHRHPFERIGTVIIIIFCLIALLLLSLNFWNQYQTDATVIVLNHDYHHYSIIKPSTIICYEDGVDEAKFPQVFEKYGIEDSKEMRDFFKLISRSEFSISIPLPAVNVSSSKWLEIIYDLRIEGLHGLPTGSTWVMTDRGFCLSINNYAAVYSSFEYWTSNNWTIIPEPQLLNTCTYLNGNCLDKYSIKGLDVLMGHTFPGDIVDFSKVVYTAFIKSSTTLTCNVNEVSASDDLRGLSFKQRDCKFKSDGGLTMWPIYTYKMCKRECIFKQMRQYCGCHHHFARPTADIPTCNVEQLHCIYVNRQKILTFDKEKARECGCLPDCNYTYYLTVDFKQFILSDTAPNETTITTILPFPIEKLIREQVFGFIDFLAAIGGAAGLVLGASILSFVEFFYFITLRCFCFYKRH